MRNIPAVLPFGSFCGTSSYGNGWNSSLLDWRDERPQFHRTILDPFGSNNTKASSCRHYPQQIGQHKDYVRLRRYDELTLKKCSVELKACERDSAERAWVSVFHCISACHWLSCRKADCDTVSVEAMATFHICWPCNRFSSFVWLQAYCTVIGNRLCMRFLARCCQNSKVVSTIAALRNTLFYSIRGISFSKLQVLPFDDLERIPTRARIIWECDFK